MTPITLTRAATSTEITRTTTTTETVTEPRESRKLFSHPVRHEERQTTPQRIATLEPMQPNDRLLGTEDLKDRITLKREPVKVIVMKVLKLQPEIHTEHSTSSLRSFG